VANTILIELWTDLAASKLAWTLVGVGGFGPSTDATLRSYGIPRDEATQTNGTSQAQHIAATNCPVVVANFNYAFPPYSLTLFAFAPTAPQLVALPADQQPVGQFIFQLQGQPRGALRD